MSDNDKLRRLIDEMLASWDTSIANKKTHQVGATERDYWQGCADAETTWIARARKLLAEPVAPEPAAGDDVLREFLTDFERHLEVTQVVSTKDLVLRELVRRALRQGGR